MLEKELSVNAGKINNKVGTAVELACLVPPRVGGGRVGGRTRTETRGLMPGAGARRRESRFPAVN